MFLNTSYPATSTRTRGFTLIELLTVIAIIGILAGIIVPVVGSVRRNAKESGNRSNLRQIGLGMNLFANDKRNFFPVAFYTAQLAAQDGAQTGDSWGDVIIPYISTQKTSGYYRDTYRAVLTSPTATLPVTDPAAAPRVNHYSMNGGIGSSAAAPYARISRLSIPRPSQVILVCDGAQSEGGAANNANAVLNQPTSIVYGGFSDPKQPVAEYTSAINVDTAAGRYYPRFRNGNNDTLYAAMVDGSVQSFKLGAVTYGNIYARQ
jgi:prepilin-type N-terminal cleavage/methylation domain-containing protein